MADTKISALTAATTPLAGTEVLPIVQSGVTKQVSVANLTAGRAVSADSLTLTGSPLPATSGGTGQSSYAVGDLLYASTTTALSKLADVATGNALISGGVGVAPSWGKIGLATHVSGTLPTTNGGTGLTSFTANGIVYASSTSALTTSSNFTYNGTDISVAGKVIIAAASKGVTSSGSTAWGLGVNGGTSIATVETNRFGVNTTGYIIDAAETLSSYGMTAVGNSDKNTVIMKMNSDDYATGSRGFINFYAIGGTYRGAIYWDGTNMQYSTASDKRLKTNIQNAGNALEKINLISIKQFDWKENGNHTDFGVIAQELYQVAPEAVSVGKDKEDGNIETPWGVDTSILVPLLVKSIQEQQSIIENLTNRINALESK